MTLLTIGKVAKATGVGVETIRFYEREGLIDEPIRSTSGYRQYGPAAIKRLRFILCAKNLGFTLQEIKELLNLRTLNGASCADVQARAVAKLTNIEQRIEQLEAMKQSLTLLINQCTGELPLGECPILEAMDEKNL